MAIRGRSHPPSTQRFPLPRYEVPAGGIVRPYVKVAGTMTRKPVKVKIAGSFVEKQLKVKIGGSFTSIV